ncbi:sugar ABC transporter ATP-binding protein [Catellatospora chokoriensis]|uniref:Multidrug ABC transporter ATP-binding protein n=1 Tax=Catellatospora chokoriensis TaxID=310353 RepID=A0A8J3NRL3_9ACTN|nr:sugar ABC transporter ATP-binding protein [Catellatospora chokoriensis]GIF90297.1 multidrug ABC transporter ATP-binding protein [Catellatospora chokoriensis]
MSEQILAARSDGPAAAGRPIVEAVDITKRYGPTVALAQAGIMVRAGGTHALVGRNGAGKSTLVAILTGLQAPDRGRVLFAGRPAPDLSDRDAWRREVACVYQKSTIIPTLTVAENLFLNRQIRGPGALIDWRATRREARRLLENWSVDVSPDQPAAALSVEQRQLVEIARALSLGARFIILDEPTAQLDAAAINRLFERIRALQVQGVTFLFISHHLQEIYDICDTVTVLRDARHILTRPVAEVTTQQLVAAMTGDDVHLATAVDRPPLPADSPAVLEVQDLLTDGVTEPLSFTVRRSEVLGLAGGGASGKAAVAEAVAGLRPAHGGTVAVTGNTVPSGSVPAALAAGIGLVPQDRHREGFVPLLSVAENIGVTAPDKTRSRGFIVPRLRDRLARTMIEALAIKTPGPELPVAGLSGGNQQKVVMARALASDPKALVLIGPTAGVDVRSKQTLLDAVDQARADGTAVLMVSDELDDLRICDRVLVLFQGRVVARMQRGWRDNDLVAAMEGINDDRN